MLFCLFMVGFLFLSKCSLKAIQNSEVSYENTPQLGH